MAALRQLLVTKRWWLLGAVLLVALLAFAACGEEEAAAPAATPPAPPEATPAATPTPVLEPTGEPIKIGVLYGLSSIAAVYTQGAVRGHNLAVTEINDAGGVLGRPLELIVRETNLSPEVGIRQANSLLFEEDVDFLMGVISSGVAQAISEFAKENKIIFIDTIAQASGTTAELGHRYVFRTTTDTVIVGRAGATVLAQRPETKYVTIGPDYAFGHDAVDDFLGKLQELNPEVEVVAQLWPPLLNPDFTTFITAILEEQPEIVYTSLWGGDLINFIKQAIPFGFFDQTTLVAYNLDLDVLRALGSEMPEGIIGGSGFPWYSLDTPEAQEFVANYFNATGNYPVVGSVLGYNATYALAAAIEKAGTTETEAVADALEGLTFDTPTGPVTIRALDHQGDPTICVGSSTQSEDFNYLYEGLGTLTQPTFPILTDLVCVSGSDVILSIEEVEARRAGQ
ncbi:MAG: ABC transporter substrate-binding protein [Dehalococcoidia bacterium]